MATKKEPSKKQLAWRKKFARMAKRGEFGKKKPAAKKRAANPSKRSVKKTVINVNPRRRAAAKKTLVLRRNPAVTPGFTVKMGPTKSNQKTISKHHSAEAAKAEAKRLGRDFPSMYVSVHS